jgi:hypothetical protein
VKLTSSTATTASGVLDEVAELGSPSSPIVCSSEIGSRAYCWISSTVAMYELGLNAEVRRAWIDALLLLAAVGAEQEDEELWQALAALDE